jgi:glycosyltransferase involved in cell wall biosynthesis
MKIVYVSTSVIPSRTANSIHVMKMCQAFVTNGHEVVLIAPNAKHLFEKGVDDVYDYYGIISRFKIIKLVYPMVKDSALIYSVAVAIEILRQKPDLVYGRFANGCALSAVLGYNTVVEYHTMISTVGMIERFFFNILIRKKSFLKLVVISQALKKIYLEEINLKKSQILVAHDGSDKVDDFQSVVPWKGRVNALQVGYFGHLYQGRGLEIILNCAKEMVEVDFHIVGGNDKDIRFWKTQNHDHENVYFHGHVPPSEVHKYRNCCDVLMAPYQKGLSIAGGALDTSKYMSPLKIFEYMASKKPIIASDMAVLREVLNKDNAILVSPVDVQEWIDAIQSLKNKKLRELIANKSYYDFVQNFTWTKRAKNLLNNVLAP